MTARPLLEVSDLTVEFATRRGIVKAVQHVNIAVAKGETLGIVGESGSGKSVTSYAVMRILDRAGKIAEGSVTFSGIDVRAASEDEMRDLRGREMSMIFQSPRLALNPIRKIGHQIEDVLLQHVQVDRSQVSEKAIEALEQVRIARPRERYHAYPFELSGGMCQRVVIALALACNPQLLIADEPTTGLDVTTQKAVMDLVVELTRRRSMSTILITHDLGLAAAYCDRIVVMEKGRVVETAPSIDIFARPSHPYTRKLMRATPRLGVALRDLDIQVAERIDDDRLSILVGLASVQLDELRKIALAGDPYEALGAPGALHDVPDASVDTLLPALVVSQIAAELGNARALQQVDGDPGMVTRNVARDQVRRDVGIRLYFLARVLHERQLLRQIVGFICRLGVFKSRINFDIAVRSRVLTTRCLNIVNRSFLADQSGNI